MDVTSIIDLLISWIQLLERSGGEPGGGVAGEGWSDPCWPNSGSETGHWRSDCGAAGMRAAVGSCPWIDSQDCVDGKASGEACRVESGHDVYLGMNRMTDRGRQEGVLCCFVKG